MKYNKKMNKRYFLVAKITGALAILTLPSASFIAPLFCTKNISGGGCDLSSIGLSYYFFFTALALAVISIVLFVLGKIYKNKKR